MYTVMNGMGWGGVLLCKVNGVYYYKRCVRCTVMNRVSENTEAVA